MPNFYDKKAKKLVVKSQVFNRYLCWHLYERWTERKMVEGRMKAGKKGGKKGRWRERKEKENKHEREIERKLKRITWSLVSIK